MPELDLHDHKSLLTGDPRTENERLVPRDPPPAASPPALTDKRIRVVVGDYRAVLPSGVQKGRRFFTNNSPVVIERRSKDATGAEKWDCVTTFSKPAPKGIDGDAHYVTEYALYWLLAGPDAE